MKVDTQALVVMVVIGIVAGWLASWVVGGGGLLRYLITGLLGAFVGGFALNAAGIPVGNIGPQAFLKYGQVVAAPQPGDIIVQSGHVAIYAGNGQAISGGMNGVNATMTHPLSWLTATGPVTFVRAG